MANLHGQFLNFDEKLNITTSKQQKLKISERNIKNNIKKYFLNHPNLKFSMVRQGSYSLGTMIRNKSDYCDIDFGLRFFPFPNLTPNTLQKYVKEALTNINQSLPVCKNKCIRIKYKGDYHLDITIYGLKGFNQTPFLATRNGWEESDPSKLKKWFDGKGNNNLPQLRRIVKYIKAWSDFKGKGLLKGIVITILVAECFVPNKRDDLALKETVKKIFYRLKGNWVCKRPVYPFEDLLDILSDTNSEMILTRLNYFIRDAEVATLNKTNEPQANILWKRHLGKYF
jgi:hypothetical protein